MSKHFWEKKGADGSVGIICSQFGIYSSDDMAVASSVLDRMNIRHEFTPKGQKLWMCADDMGYRDLDRFRALLVKEGVSS